MESLKFVQFYVNKWKVENVNDCYDGTNNLCLHYYIETEYGLIC